MTKKYCEEEVILNKTVLQTYLAEPFCLTAHSRANDQLLYFTTSSLTVNDRNLIFISDRTGSPNLFCRDLKSGKERPITINTEGYLKSYVYFDGNDEHGLGKASVSLHAPSGKVYYIQGRKICQTDHHGKIRYLAEIPVGQVSAFTHVSLDGKLLCVPTTDRRALDGEFENNKPLYDIDELVQTENLNSYLRVFDTSSGKQLLCERVPRAWVTHVQFCPTNTRWILYNHEWPSDCGIRRIWLWDGSSHIRIRSEGNGRNRQDWACHEVWESDGKAIVYHGGYSNGSCLIGRVAFQGGIPLEPVEIALKHNYSQYGHFTLHDSNRLLVSDGYYLMEHSDKLRKMLTNQEVVCNDLSETGEEKKQWGGVWISLQVPDWNNHTITWIPICRHRSNWDSQDSHPHPIFNHAGNAILYTSNWEGHRAIYKVKIPNLNLS